MNSEELKRLYLHYAGHLPEQMQPLTPAGSNRHYFRLGPCPTVIGVQGESKDENRAFVYMAGYFREKGISVPKILACSDDGLHYLQEDLGDTLLFDAIAQGRISGSFNDAEQALLHKTIALLPTLQMEGADMDFAYCYPQPELNRRSILWDLNYFKYCYLKATGLTFSEDRLEDDFQRMTDTLPQAGICGFMYRDFQSRNVMLKDGTPWFIDFQGGRKGPVYYDVASFLWQAKANYPDELKEALLHTYLEALGRYRQVDEQDFRKHLRHFVLFRHLQVLGAYGFRGYFERKPHFLESIPFALRNLRKLLQEPFAEYPYLCQLLQRLTEPAGEATGAKAPGLTVRITSFSYKKGLPPDPSGNGGGYVFDCRALHNPGRYECYRKLNGLDEPVVRFLEDDGEILRFLEHVYALVDASVARYLERGFDSLSVCFGCTGGQHRSVYAAQHLAEHLHEKYPVRIVLQHREQGIETTLQPDEQQ